MHLLLILYLRIDKPAKALVNLLTSNSPLIYVVLDMVTL